MTAERKNMWIRSTGDTTHKKCTSRRKLFGETFGTI